MRRLTPLALLAVAGCVDVQTLVPYGPTPIAVGGRGAYALVSQNVYDGCQPYSRPDICAADDLQAGSATLREATSSDPAILEVLEIAGDRFALAVGRSEGQVTLTLTTDTDHELVVDAVMADRIELDKAGCEDGALAIGTSFCTQVVPYRGSQPLAGAQLEVTIDPGTLTDVVEEPSYHNINMHCFQVPPAPGATDLAITFTGLTEVMPVTYYDLPQVDGIATAMDPPTGPYPRFANDVYFRRTLSIAGEPVCEENGSDPSIWTTTWRSETPEVCTVGLYGDTELESVGTATNVQGRAAGACRVTATVGALSETLELTIE